MNIDWIDAAKFAPSPEFHGVKVIVKVLDMKTHTKRFQLSFIDYQQGGWANCCNDISDDDCILDWAFITEEMHNIRTVLNVIKVSEY